MTVSTSRTFRSGDSEAVCLPHDVAFGRELDLTLVRSGDILTIYPVRASVADLLQRLATMPRPIDIESREDEPLPEPPGL